MYGRVWGASSEPSWIEVRWVFEVVSLLLATPRLLRTTSPRELHRGRKGPSLIYACLGPTMQLHGPSWVLLWNCRAFLGPIVELDGFVGSYCGIAWSGSVLFWNCMV